MIYFILFLIPVIATIIFFTVIHPTEYNIISKEIQPKGECFMLISKTKYDNIKYENINVSRETFDKFTRGKISSRDYKEIKRGD